MTRQTIRTNYLQTIDWLNDSVVDWVCGGQLYSLNGGQKQIGTSHYAFSFDASITSADGQYAFVYKRLGTKGLLLKHGEIIREINRPYYHAETYEYPAAFITFHDKTYLVHCPFDYCRLDFEEVETGKIVTDVKDRKPNDVFHSRLTISPDNKHLMVCGWVWQPMDIVELYNIADCFENPHLLDKSGLHADFGTEINAASFINESSILMSSSEEFDDDSLLPPKHIAIWNFITNKLSAPVKTACELGNLFAIDENRAWDMYKFPKLINIQTGEVESKIEDIDSGLQNSSICRNDCDFPQIRFNRNNSQIAVRIDSTRIEIISP